MLQLDHSVSISGAAAKQLRRPSPPADPQTCPPTHSAKARRGLALNQIPMSGEVEHKQSTGERAKG